MTRVKIIAVEQEWWRFIGRRMGGNSSICVSPEYVGKMGETTGGEVVASTGDILYREVRLDDGETFLFDPDHLQEIAE